jgi:hypothetical protein
MTLEKTDQAVSQSIQLFNDFAKQGIEFIYQQSPELCQQIVLRAEFQQLTIFFIFLIISTTLFCLSCKWKKYEQTDLRKFIEEDESPSIYYFTRFV